MMWYEDIMPSAINKNNRMDFQWITLEGRVGSNKGLFKSYRALGPGNEAKWVNGAGWAMFYKIFVAKVNSLSVCDSKASGK